MKYSIAMLNDGFVLMRGPIEIGQLVIGPEATLSEARDMLADLNSADATRQMLCDAQAEIARLREALAFYAGTLRADGNGFDFAKEPSGFRGEVARTALVMGGNAK